MDLPTGTVTFLFSDIEGSTRLWEEHPASMGPALAWHDNILREAIERNDGVVFKTVGDAFCAAFQHASDAVSAAAEGQQALARAGWPDALSLKVRMALHTGSVESRDNDYFGQPLNRVSRLLTIGHGGQVLLSDVTHDLSRDLLPAGCTVRALGEHRLKDLGRPEIVFQLCHPDLRGEFPPLRSLESVPNNLPQQVTSFIGREKELVEIKALLERSRLVTLTGSGGCGKTRLALQAAADLLDVSGDGVWLVELASLTDPGLVPRTVAGPLGVSEEPGEDLTQALADALKAKRLLLVLDNCEHLLDASARLADALLRGCPHVLLLATSREGMGISGELTYQVPSLSLPDPKRDATPEALVHFEAVRLFIERALFHQPQFAVTSQNAPALASVCHRLDGIPLAIELAAARVRNLTVEEVNQKLDQRFRLLTGGSRTALPRQQTLRSLIDWSYDLLNEPEKALFRRLSVFCGGWTLESAEQVCAGGLVEEWEVLDLLTSLSDKSLVAAEEREGRTRYRLLETVRQYARDRLLDSGEGGSVRARHRDRFLTLAEEIQPRLTGPEQGRWYSVLEEEHDNLRTALTFCVDELEGYEGEQDPGHEEKGLRLAGALQWFWLTRGHLREGRERLDELLSHPATRRRTKARAFALNGAGLLAFQLGDAGAARALHEESLSIRRELGDKRGIAGSLNNLGIVARGRGDYETARSLYEEALSINREMGNRAWESYNLANLGIVAQARGDVASARSLQEQSLAIKRELGDRRGIALSLHAIGLSAYEQGEYASARALLRESLGLCHEVGDPWCMAAAFRSLGEALAAIGDWTRAAQLWGVADRLQETVGIREAPGDPVSYEARLAETRAALGDAAFDAAWEEGRAMPLEQAAGLALEASAA
jgi:predicted ATPase/class 3 adenylate cyclase